MDPPRPEPHGTDLRHTDHPPGHPPLLEALRTGRLRVLGRLVAASNATFLGEVIPPGGHVALHVPAQEQPGRERPLDAADVIAAARERGAMPVVYKPIRGERPLWDFPPRALAAREVAAYLVSEALAWSIVPPTVLRGGPFGKGMVQAWIDVDDSVDRVQLVRSGDPSLRGIALFDAIVNNADRKIGHLLPVRGGHVFGVDHGICFAAEPKLRTVLWHWIGVSFDDGETAALRRLEAALGDDSQPGVPGGPPGRSLGRSLAGLLSPPEIEALRYRILALLEAGAFPTPEPDRPAIPWPLV